MYHCQGLTSWTLYEKLVPVAVLTPNVDRWKISFVIRMIQINNRTPSARLRLAQKIWRNNSRSTRQGNNWESCFWNSCWWMQTSLALLKKITTEVRVIFDASAKVRKGVNSFNDCWYQGPIMMLNLCGLRINI